MVEIPASLQSVFSATVRERDGSYVVEVPPGEIERDVVEPDGTYRIAIFDVAGGDGKREHAGQRGSRSHTPGPPSPPVDEGEVREVTIESIGDQGDGIAKVERGYVVIVPGAEPGDQPTVEIDTVRKNVAFGRVVDRSPGAR